MNDLDRLGMLFGSKKSSNYDDFCGKYEKHLPFSRDAKIKILELGSNDDGAIRMWNKFYENSIVMGESSDSLNRYSFDKYIIDNGPFDFIIDNDSLFTELFDSVASGGVYAIEDTKTLNNRDNVTRRLKMGDNIEFFKELIERIHISSENDENNDFFIESKIESIIFLNSLILITKK